MIVKLLTEHHLEFLGCRGLYKSSLVKIPHHCKSHVAAQMIFVNRHPMITKAHHEPMDLVSETI